MKMHAAVLKSGFDMKAWDGRGSAQYCAQHGFYLSASAVASIAGVAAGVVIAVLLVVVVLALACAQANPAGMGTNIVSQSSGPVSRPNQGASCESTVVCRRTRNHKHGCAGRGMKGPERHATLASAQCQAHREQTDITIGSGGPATPKAFLVSRLCSSTWSRRLTTTIPTAVASLSGLASVPCVLATSIASLSGPAAIA